MTPSQDCSFFVLIAGQKHGPIPYNAYILGNFKKSFLPRTACPDLKTILHIPILYYNNTNIVFVILIP